MRRPSLLYRIVDRWLASRPDWRRRAQEARRQAAQALEWQPIETYPLCDACGKPDCDWGPEVALLVPACEHYAYRATRYIGHKEAGMWLIRDADHPSGWSELHCAPSHWAWVPEIPGIEETP